MKQLILKMNFNSWCFKRPTTKALCTKKVSSKLDLRTLSLFILLGLLCAVFSSHAQESPVNEAHLSLENMLSKAEELIDSDRHRSITLSNDALRRAKETQDQIVIAKAHHLLGNIYTIDKNNAAALSHYAKAVNTFLSLELVTDAVNVADDYLDLLLELELLGEAEALLTLIKDDAIEYEESTTLGRLYVDLGEGYYREKLYNEAIQRFHIAISYFTEDSPAVRDRIARTYNEIAAVHKRLKDRSSASKAYKKALDIFVELDDKSSLARNLNMIAEAERYMGNIVDALNFATKSIDIHKGINDKEGYAKALQGAGIIYRQIGRYEKSLEHMLQANELYKELGDNDGMAKASNQIGLIYSRLKQYEQAKWFYESTIELAKNNIKSSTLAVALREMAVIETRAANFESALLMGLRALEIYKNENEMTKVSQTARIIANAHRAIGNSDQAIAFYRESVAVAESISRPDYQVKAMVPLADMIRHKSPSEALTLLKTAQNLSAGSKDKSLALSIHRGLRKTLADLNKFEQAYDYATEEIYLMEDIQKVREEDELTKAKANMLSHKMELELESLRKRTKLDTLELARKENEVEIAEQARTISELELMKNKYASITLLMLLLVCIFLIAFVYVRFSASKKRNIELDQLAAKDPLTGCFNRRVLFKHLEKKFKEKNPEESFCIIMIDVDHFKTINDSYGHIVGDQVLMHLSAILRENIRQSDMVARYGGEEYCMLLENTDIERATEIAEALREKIAQTEICNISITCSFGVSTIKDKAENSDALIEQADVALYTSKAQGRNLVTIWSKDLAR